MRALLLTDLHLGLTDLLEDRGLLLSKTHAGKAYQARLQRSLERIGPLVPATKEGRPLVGQLADTDGGHDDYGAAIWHFTEAFRRAPGVSDEVRAAAQRVRSTFVPELAVLSESYATEVAAAVVNREALPARKADLKLFPLPGRSTLAVWAEQFVAHGEKLGVLLKQRAGETAEQHIAAKTEASSARGEAIGLLSRLRTAVQDELGSDLTKWRAYDAELFAYLDQLARDREAALRRRGNSNGKGGGGGAGAGEVGDEPEMPPPESQGGSAPPTGPG